MEKSKKGLLERLDEGVVIGDGSFVVTLERRGYVLAGTSTPEAAVQHPDAVRQLHREYLRAGADVMQTFSFNSADDKLIVTGVYEEVINCSTINTAACDIARQVASEGDALVAGSVSPVQSFMDSKGKDVVMTEFEKQVNVFTEKNVDFLLGEFFGYVQEAEWAIEAMKQVSLPVACSMKIGLMGDMAGISPQECAVRMAKAGADVVGINCLFDPFICLETMKMMKDALDEAGLVCHLMAQPVGWHTTELRDDVRGYQALPEYPLAMEPRLLTRTDARTFARAAYNLGIRYIGGCCGFEPYHIRAIAEELAAERGKRPPGQDKSANYTLLAKSLAKEQRKRASRKYWEDLIPATGRTKMKILTEIKE
ncbi:betaine--homocysteine S-methyltransferase 1-like [Apostichopus japonicus]|uniref:betaine--homocysteine S-methyltransferase 1-like n=1 Tax=Stichopus japonicus TaxID=307972 RepID=UPI003AB49142